MQFEFKNDIFTGYNLHWFNVNGSFGNTQNKLYNDTLRADSLITFSTSDYERYKLNANYNFVHNGTKTLQFFTLSFISLYNTNFLENRKLNDIPYIQKNPEGKKYVFSNDTENVNQGPLDKLKKNIWIYNPSAYYSIFCIAKKSLGFEVGTDYKHHMNKLKEVDFASSYSAYVGLIFRVNSKDVLSKATIGIDAGYYDAQVDGKAKDFFSFRAKLGVPFNTIAKK